MPLPRVLTYETAKAQIDKTLKDSSLTCLDLILIHAPLGGPEGCKRAWKALVRAQEAGKVRILDVSNYGVHHLEELEAYIKELEKGRGKGKGGVIDVGQWELHPWLARPDIVQWCRQHGIILQAYSLLVMAKRLDDPLLQPLIKKHGKSAVQILLRWSLQTGFSPLPKSVKPSRIEENANVYDFELMKEDMDSLDTSVYVSCTWNSTLITVEQ
jgi:diketogulonate reductase-like aldo/keto reductase